MSPLAKLGKKGSLLLSLASVLGWVAIFAFVVWPALRGSREGETHIDDMSDRIELLGGWHDGRRQLVVEDDAWNQELNDRFDTMFPRERDLEQLFYDIAAAANRSAVDPVQISVKNAGFEMERRDEIPPTDLGDDMDDYMDGDMDDGGSESLYDNLGLSPADFASAELESHYLFLHLDAGYENIASFLDEVSRLPRAVTVNKLNMQQGGSSVVAFIELEYYVQAAN